MSVWDDREFADRWNQTYGLDMSRAPIRSGLVYPIIADRINWPSIKTDEIDIADFGCGNGNFIRAFSDRPFVRWLGIDAGAAILSTALPLEKEATVRFIRRDLSEPIKDTSDHHHVVSVFTLEEIPADGVSIFFNNMAAAIKKRSGQVHIFTQHPAYALERDIVSNAAGTENEKFPGHNGYFDTNPTAYQLSILNMKKGFPYQPRHHHKPMATILNGLASAELGLKEIIEVPAGVGTVKDLKSHIPKRGDVPRFLSAR